MKRTGLLSILIALLSIPAIAQTNRPLWSLPITNLADSDSIIAVKPSGTNWSTVRVPVSSLPAVLSANYTKPSSPALSPAFAPPPVTSISTGLRLPPMGWHPWNQFACNVNQTLLVNTAKELKRRGIAIAGYTNSISTDDGWQTGRDGTGYPIADPARYPSGLVGLVYALKAEGFGATVWTPMDPYTGSAVGSCGHNQGSGGYEAQDVAAYMAAGFDYIKLDNFGGSDISVKIPLWRSIMTASNYKAHLMTVGYGFWWPPFAAYVNQMRVNTDIRPTWPYVMAQVAAQEVAAPYSQPGLYPDMDMLEVGVTNAYGNLTYDENLTHFQLWCMMSAPLILGCNVTNLAPTLVNIITNRALLDIDQDGGVISARLVKRTRNATGSLDVYLKPIGWIGSGTNALMLFNNSTTPSYIPIAMRELGLASSTVRCVSPGLEYDHGTVADYFRPSADYYYSHQSKVFILTSTPNTGAVVRAYSDYIVNGDSNVSLSGNFSGNVVTNRQQLPEFSDLTNSGTLYNSGSIRGYGGMTLLGGNLIAASSDAKFATVSGDGSGLTNLNPNAITNAPWFSSASNAWNGTFTGNGGGLTNLNLSTATGLLPMGTVATQYQTAPGPFLSTNSGARGYSYNGGSLTNFQSIRSGSIGYALTDNTEKFIAWSGSVASGNETYAAAPMALGGTFSKFYLAIHQIGAGGTNIAVRIYTNGVYCGLGATLRGPGTSTNELSTVTGVVPDGALVSIGIQSSYNGVHPTLYFKWSWVSTK